MSEPARTASAPTADGFVTVARAGDVEDGAPLAADLPSGTPICLARVGGDIVAFADGCTHREYPLSAGELLSDGTIECPWHGARFDCRTGAVRKGPACKPIAVYETRVVDGDIQVRPKATKGS